MTAELIVLYINRQMTTPEISVVIPAYNAEKYIAESVLSVINQTFNLWELIIVDDGSTDSTVEIIKRFYTDTRIILVRQANKGVSAARNTGIKTAKGKFIAFLDADDYYLPLNLEEKYNLLMQDNAIDFVYCDVMQCDEKLNDVKIEKGLQPENLFTKVLQWQGETIPTLPSNIVVKASLMKGKYLFDEQLSNCADRFMKIQLSKETVAGYIPKALVKYRNTPGSMSKKVELLEHDELYIAKKIIAEKILPPGKFRRKVIANMYFIISGSWYRDGGRTMRAIKFALKAMLIYPPIILRFIKKSRFLIPTKK